MLVSFPLLLLSLPLLCSTHDLVDYKKLPWGPHLECLHLQLVCLHPENTIISFDRGVTDGGSIPSWVGGPKVKLWPSGPPKTNIRVGEENGDAYSNADRHYILNIRLAASLERPDTQFLNATALVLAPAWYENFGHSLYALGALWGAYSAGVFNGSANVYVASGDGGPVSQNSLEFLRVLPQAKVWDSWAAKQCYHDVDLCRLDTNPMDTSITNNLWAASQAVVARIRHSFFSGGPESSNSASTAVISVVFATRSWLRDLKNTPELVEACNRFSSSNGVSFHCKAHAFGKNISHDICLMQSTNVLLAVHGASLANSLFMKEGTSHAVEIVSDYAPKYVAEHHEHYLRATLYRIKYWKVVVRNSSQIFPSNFQQRNVGNRLVWGRDKVVSLKVQDLKDVLERIASVAVGGNVTNRYATLNQQGKHILYSD